MGLIKLEINVDVIYGQSQSSHVTVLCQGPDKKYNGFSFLKSVRLKKRQN